LHEALLAKHANQFWQCWNAKFSNGTGHCKQVDGYTDHQQIADNFGKHFTALGSAVQTNANRILQHNYEFTRPNYVGSPFLHHFYFDAEVVGNVIIDLK